MSNLVQVLKDWFKSIFTYYTIRPHTHKNDIVQK